MEFLSNILADKLEEIADKLRKGTSTIDKDTALECFEILAVGDKSEVLGKELASKYMNMSRATFDNYINLDLIPKGKKLRGLKELTWNKLELEAAKLKIEKYLNKI